MTDTRPDGRSFSEVRPIEITTGFMPHAEGSVLIKNGDTHVACSATVQHYVPPWLRGQGRGWVTAEYGMLPTVNWRPRGPSACRYGADAPERLSASSAGHYAP